MLYLNDHYEVAPLLLVLHFIHHHPSLKLQIMVGCPTTILEIGLTSVEGVLEFVDQLFFDHMFNIWLLIKCLINNYHV
jgi:hypothetical protein